MERTPSSMTRKVLELIEMKAWAAGADVLSSPALDGVLGEGERVVVHAAVAFVAGGTASTAQLSLSAEDSPDGRNWASIGSTPFVNGTVVSLSDVPVAIRGVVPWPHGRFLRIRMSLDGGNPTVWMGVRATLKPGEGEA